MHVSTVNMCHYWLNPFKLENKVFFTILFDHERVNFKAENDIFRFLSMIFKNANFFFTFGNSPSNYYTVKKKF